MSKVTGRGGSTTVATGMVAMLIGAVPCVTLACSLRSGAVDAADGGVSDAGSDVRTGPFACDPLDPNEEAIALRHVVGIGKDTDGTIYVLDDDKSRVNYRLFQSQGQNLQLLHGSLGSSTPTHVSMDAVASAGALTLEVDVSGDVARAMGIVFGPIANKDFTIGSPGDVLELLTQASIANLTPKGLGFSVIYNATTPDAYRLVVLEPMNGATSELDYRIFYRTDENLLERHLVWSGSGSIMGFDFTVDGTEYGATFVDSPLRAPDIVNNLTNGGPPAFKGGAALTLHPPSSASSLKYLCTQ